VLNLAFAKAEPGEFDEFPAFVAIASGLRYALLGVPDPSEDICDEPSTDFELQVSSITRTAEPAIDISKELLAKLKEGSRLRC
jgi:hypothetical protein